MFFKSAKGRKMPIDIDKMVINDIGREVEYTSWGNAKEKGIIVSWNPRYIFVKFGYSNQSAACKPQDLNFIKEKR